MSTESCLICCDTYNNSTKKKTCCAYCDFAACRTCCQTYILNETIVKCMNPATEDNGTLKCGKEWSSKFIRQSFPNAFITTKLKSHQSDILLEQERALLPATQPLVEEEIRREKIKLETIEIEKTIRNLIQQKKDLATSLYHVNYTKKEVAKFIRACSDTNCRGFLSSQWKCGICEQWSCPDCHELKGPNKDAPHTCDPNNVATAKLLATDTKGCPLCRTNIFKISGCDQMWCTQCHTAFSWKTGNIENTIHNPHYYEWKRNNGGLARAAGDVQCGHQLDHRTVDTIIQLVRTKHTNLQPPGRISQKQSQQLRPLVQPLPIHLTQTQVQPLPLTQTHEAASVEIDRNRITHIYNVVRNTLHLIMVELPVYQVDYVARNRDLRVKYLRNLITEESFKEQLQRNDKKHKKNTEICQVFQLANTAITDIVLRVIDNLSTSAPNAYNLSAISEVDEIVKYCNDILKEISHTYNSVQYELTDTIRFMKIEIEKKKKEKEPVANGGDQKLVTV